ncbi:CYTH domain-containing protein [Flavimobilis marinus]|uniref:CYTH domain-containing protein n=2 Tax=Flavimobilis marinus TaxID=285351 RepID=A0A1I2DUB3_9MICO|nr:CYTH domain-containing protein [Flavimobilis marinus]
MRHTRGGTFASMGTDEDMTMSDTGYGDFEFERRFLVREVPDHVLAEPDPVLIVQSYFLAADGYAMRLRVQASSVLLAMDGTEDPLDVLDRFAAQFDFCALTVKGPQVGGTRYEAERQIDVHMGVEMIRRGGARIVKNRYATWIGADGWVIDVFGGANHPLVVAECERGGPVTDLSIPDFAITEITDDWRFANESLSQRPFGPWAAAYDVELAQAGPRFLQGFGENTLGRDGL